MTQYKGDSTAMTSKTKKHILIVEDNETYRKMIGMRFKSHGYRVSEAEDGVKGLEFIRKKRPDLIMLDLLLPLMDGHKVCRLVKYDKKLQEIPIIILTSRDRDEDAELAKSCGADAFIVKNTRSEIIIDVIERIFEKAEKERLP